MLDIIGGLSLTALFFIGCGLLIAFSPVAPGARVKLALTAVRWFTGTGILAALGLFSAQGAGTPAIGAAFLAPIVVLRADKE